MNGFRFDDQEVEETSEVKSNKLDTVVRAVEGDGPHWLR